MKQEYIISTSKKMSMNETPLIYKQLHSTLILSLIDPV